jgi:benzaldehyde dehydrogenase (NAD)
LPADLRRRRGRDSGVTPGQTVDDAPNLPFGGALGSGTGARFGGASNLDAFTETRWVTVQGEINQHPF